MWGWEGLQNLAALGTPWQGSSQTEPRPWAQPLDSSSLPDQPPHSSLPIRVLPSLPLLPPHLPLPTSSSFPPHPTFAVLLAAPGPSSAGGDSAGQIAGKGPSLYLLFAAERNGSAEGHGKSERGAFRCSPWQSRARLIAWPQLSSAFHALLLRPSGSARLLGCCGA